MATIGGAEKSMSPSHRDAFYDFVYDGTGNYSIPTAFGRRPVSGCACRFHGLQTQYKSRHSRGGTASDDMHDVPYCLSTFDPSGSSRESNMFDWHFAPDQPDSCNVEIMHESTPMLHQDRELITKCLTPDRSSPDHPTKTMFIIGDCHVGVLLPALSLASRGMYQMRHIQANSVGVFPQVEYGVSPQRFDDFYADILATLHKEMERDDVLVVAQYAGNWRDRNNVAASSAGAGAMPMAMSDTGEPGAATGAVGKSDGNSQVSPAFAGKHRVLSSTPLEMMERDLLKGIVEMKHGKLLVFGEWPYWTGPAFGEGKQPKGLPSKSDGDVEFQAALQRDIQPLLKRHPALRYNSLLPLFCNRGTVLDNNWNSTPPGACSWNVPGTNIAAYSNSNHLTTTGSIYLWPHICDMLNGDYDGP
jgi:hypothetical protein